MARILIVEDEEQVRMVLREVLKRSGHKVVEASNGKSAMKLYKEVGAELIITDLIMPEQEGLETIMELKRDFPEVKIIAISGGGRVGPEDYLKMAKKLGADRTLTKPIRQEDLLKTVEELLG